ncbi:FkbM family methyltransferase [Afipia felis]|uniref:2-O-methyltransferase NoeI n=2 Tax=Afipia felis TaxID=1035 RepID=A0A380W6L4_AFIFE|nr:FkbM family methyltransferase [Afipia felis]EKS27740.1 FkbM family methyltransferase [Afipia felis ATCC 53690]SUU76450.1 2-O-methyltransferase NoeI [Afipia felis]SUU84516.1 2-O-methyltransferase NoeI [Afipia felis]
MKALEFARLMVPPIFSRTTRRHLRDVWRHHIPTLTHERTLDRFRSAGFAPKTIYDIGAFRGHWTREARRIFPSAAFYLFEANNLHAPFLEKTGHPFFIAAMSVEDNEAGAPLFINETIQTSTSLHRERTQSFNDNVKIVQVPTRRLDSLVTEKGLPAPDLIKLDVQGAEIDVLKGAGKVLENASAIVAELSFLPFNAGAPLIGETITYIEGLGFKCADVCETHSSAIGSILQMDIIFARPALFQRYAAAAGL